MLYSFSDGMPQKIHETNNCSLRLRMSKKGTTVALYFLSFLLIVLICALIYLQRIRLQKKFEPILNSVNKRVRYTTIATGETREDV